MAADSFDYFYSVYYCKIKEYINAKVNENALAEELTQDVFTSALRTGTVLTVNRIVQLGFIPSPEIRSTIIFVSGDGVCQPFP